MQISIPAMHGSLLDELDNMSLPRDLFRDSLTLGSFGRAIALASLLLNSFNSREISQGASKRRDTIRRQSPPWMSNGYNRLRKVVSGWLQSSGLSFNAKDEEVVLHFLGSMSRFYLSEPFVTPSSPYTNPSCPWPQALGQFLLLGARYPLPTLQTGLSQFLNEGLQVSPPFHSSVAQTKKIFLPALANVEKSNEGHSSALEPCLVAAIENLQLAMLNPVTATTRSTEDPAKSHDPVDSTTNQRPAPLEGELNGNSRSSKRLCLSAETQVQDPFQVLMRRLSELLNCSSMKNLANLRAAIEYVHK